MSNIRVRNCNSSLEFVGDYEIKSVEMKSGDELNGEAIMRVLVHNKEYEMRVSVKKGKKEGMDPEESVTSGPEMKTEKEEVGGDAIPDGEGAGNSKKTKWEIDQSETTV